MASIVLSDEQQKALETGRHLVVRANAGSGKTFLLTLRIAWLLIEHGVALDRIVAITFTTKAAAEMRTRVQKLLLQLYRDQELRASLGFTVSDTVILKRITQSLNELGKARISTFHSFAASLVRQHGFELGVDPESRQISDREQGVLLTSATRAAIRSALRSGTITAAHELLGILNTEQRILGLVRSGEYLDRLTSWQQHLPAPVAEVRSTTIPLALSALILNIGHTVLADLRELAAQQSAAGEAACLQLAEHLRTLRDTPQDPVHARKIIEVLKGLFTKGGTGKKQGAPFEQTPDLQPLPGTWTQLQSWAESLTPQDELRQAQALEAILTVAADAEERFARLKRQKVVIDFDDMMRFAVRLFREHRGIAEGIRNSISYLLVDEFQDTNPLQYTLVRELIPDLDGKSLRKAELYVVGDDKQSIYGFRNADVRLFRKLDEAVTAANYAAGIVADSNVRLVNSYRMTPLLAADVNRICNEAFRAESEFDVEYAPLISVRNHSAVELPGSLRVSAVVRSGTSTNVDMDDSEADQIEQQDEVEEVVQRVCAILSGTDPLLVVHRTENGPVLLPPTASDIAILARRKDTVSAIARRLQQLQVAVQVYGGRDFFSRSEISDIRNLLITISGDEQPFALASVLRSPIFRCTDADLLDIATAGNRHAFSWKGLEAFARTTQASSTVREAVTTIEALRVLAHTHPLADVVQQALIDTQWHGTLIDDPRKEQVLGNVAKLLDIIRAAGAVNGATLYDVLVAIAVPDSTDNEAEDDSNTNGAGVKVMTLHASKGLEFPIVIIADISSKGRPSAFLESDELGPTYPISTKRVIADVPTTAEATSVGASHYANAVMTMLKDTAEARRLLYVALTRAEFHVLILLRLKESKSGSISVGGSIANLLIDLYPLLPALDAITSTSPCATPATSEHAYIDLREQLPKTNLVDVCNITDFVKHEDLPDTLTIAEARERGIKVHKAIAEILQHDRNVTTHADPIVQGFIDARSSWEHIPDDASIEEERVALLDDIVIVGRPDVSFRADNGHVHVWDWKTIAPVSGLDQQALLEAYRHQLAGYAWLLMVGDETIIHVDARLLFVPLASSSLDQWSVGITFTRADVPHIADAMRSRMAIPAA